MVIGKKTTKEKIKSFITNRKNHFKYRRFDMQPENSTPKKRSFGKIFANLFQRILVVLARFIFKNVVYSAKGASMPPIKNLLLLEPATVLAMKIRTKKVTLEIF